MIGMPFDDKNIHMIPDDDMHDGYDSADDKDDNDWFMVQTWMAC